MAVTLTFWIKKLIKLAWKYKKERCVVLFPRKQGEISILCKNNYILAITVIRSFEN